MPDGARKADGYARIIGVTFTCLRKTPMRIRIALILPVLLASVSISAQQAPAPPPVPAPPPATSTVAPGIPGVVTAGTTVQVIKEGFNGTEGPIALPDGTVAFTETNANRILKIDAQNNVTTYLENSNGSNALSFDARGRLFSVQTVPGSTRVGIIAPANAVATIVEVPGGRPNDLIVDKTGGIYYTVPGPSVPPGQQAPPPGSFAPAVYYIPPGKPAVKVADGIQFPNGVILSRDEKTLYIANTQGDSLIAFDVTSPGMITNRRDLAKYEGVTKNPQTGNLVSGADGMAIDSEGRIYVATAAGVQVFTDKGQYLGTIPTSRAPQNIAFAGPDKKTLYIVGRGAAWKVQMLSQGPRERAK